MLCHDPVPLTGDGRWRSGWQRRSGLGCEDVRCFEHSGVKWQALDSGPQIVRSVWQRNDKVLSDSSHVSEPAIDELFEDTAVVSTYTSARPNQSLSDLLLGK